jgi:hypothetical protein
MKIIKISALFVLIASLVLLAACSKDDDPQVVKSSEKSITVFKFSGLTPEVTGTIIEPTHQISASVPHGTAVTALAPTIEISEKATLSPASGTAQNFTNPVAYTVTAEDGTTQEYVVTITVDESIEKKITEFKFAGFSPEIIGTITETDQKISAMVPNGTDVTALVPTIKISEAASISPASGVARNFTDPVTYTVTAEDGSVQSYLVTILIDPTVSFVINKEFQAYNKIGQKSYFVFGGENFGDYSNNRLQFVNTLTEEVLEIPASDISSETTFIVEVPEDFPMGQYRIKVFVGVESKFMELIYEVVEPWQEIDGVDKTYLSAGEEIVITGKYFLASGNKVNLSGSGPEIPCEIVAESTTSITAKIPDQIYSGEYSIGVKKGVRTELFYILTIDGLPAPTIISTDKLSYNRGQTITMTGENLKKAGLDTKIHFLPIDFDNEFPVETGAVNSAGTQMTFVIPMDFPTGTYNLVVEINGGYGPSYNETIQINP